MADTSENDPLPTQFVRSFVARDVVDSTNDYAAALARGGSYALPLVVRARHQTDGRGRGTNRWWSDAGSLTFTLAINPMAHGLTAENESKLALAMAVAVIDAVGELGLGKHSIGIRWPNDIEVDGRKLGGILPQRIETSYGHCILIGVGVNVLTNLENAPDDVREMATSLAALHVRPIDQDSLSRIQWSIVNHFEPVLGRLATGDPTLPAHWNQLDLLRDQWVRVDQGTTIVAGLGRGIGADGALCLDDGQRLIRFFGGQVLRQ
jgi:BirA family transcriptional regulator, biotin operon repressor / biotin---[acetyl-CoA-carboxylase] ligase